MEEQFEIDEQFVNIDPNIKLDRFLHLKNIASNIFSKYHYSNMDISNILEKCKEIYKNEKMNTREIKLFEKIYAFFHKKSLYNQIQNKKYTNTFGKVIPASIEKNIYKPQKESNEHIDQIIQIAKTNKNEYMRAVFQSNLWSDDDMTNLLFQGTPGGGPANITCMIHPVLIALFTLKINILDNRIIHTNLAKIIVDRLNNEPLRTKHDFEFYMDLITNKKQIICDKFNIFADLKKRVNLQESLRNIIWRLRSRQMANCANLQILNVIDDCTLNPVESANYSFLRDEGKIIKTILDVFCLNPTYVTTMPVFDLTKRTMPIHKIDKLAMINVNLPNSLVESHSEPIELKSGLNMPNWHYENGLIVPKKQNIIYSKEILIYYVNRKFKTVPTVYNNTYRFRRLPVSISNREKFNSHQVNFKYLIKENQQKFKLQSVVCISSFQKRNKEEDDKLIKDYTGCYTYLLQYDDTQLENWLIDENTDYENENESNIAPNKIIEYDPYGYSTLINSDEEDVYKKGKQIKRYAKHGFRQIYLNNQKIQKEEEINPNEWINHDRASHLNKKLSREGHIFIYVEPIEDLKNMQTVESFDIDYRPKF